jgi:hypothetical protein
VEPYRRLDGANKQPEAVVDQPKAGVDMDEAPPCKSPNELNPLRIHEPLLGQLDKNQLLVAGTQIPN